MVSCLHAFFWRVEWCARFYRSWPADGHAGLRWLENSEWTLFEAFEAPETGRRLWASCRSGKYQALHSILQLSRQDGTNENNTRDDRVGEDSERL